jgi:hypothetical protein
LDWAEDVMAFFTRKSFWITFISFASLSFGIFYFATYFFFDLDKSSSEFANMSVLIGSISTAITFVFLIIQNIKIREQQKIAEIKQTESEFRLQKEARLRQKAADKRQQLFELRQTKLWNSQHVKINFEMYQAHKREFFSVLDDIEKSSFLTIEFYNREGLYRSIYPMNSFNHVSLDVVIDNSDDCVSGSLADINTMYLLTIDQLTKLSNYIIDGKERRSAVYDHLDNLLFLSSKLNLMIISKGNFGDLCWNEHVVLNAYELNDTVNTLHHAFKGIMVFVGNSDIDDISHLTGSFYYDAMQEVLFKHPRIKQMYDFNLDNTGYAIALYDLYIFFSDNTIRNLDNNQGYLQLYELMNDGGKVDYKIKDKDALYRLVNKLREQFFVFQDLLPSRSVQYFEHIMSTFSDLFVYAEQHLSHESSSKA